MSWNYWRRRIQEIKIGVFENGIDGADGNGGTAKAPT
jgi:hypothetical protein